MRGLSSRSSFRRQSAAASIRTDTACMRPHSWAVQGRIPVHGIQPRNQALPAPQSGPTCTPIGPYLHSYRALSALLSGLICTSIRPYLHSYQALPALQSGLTCKADQGSSGHPAKAGGRPGRCFSPGDRRERLLTDVTVYVYLRNKNYGLNIYFASCRYLCPTSAGAVFPSRPALRRI